MSGTLTATGADGGGKTFNNIHRTMLELENLRAERNR